MSDNKLKICVYAISKNEEKFVERFFKSAQAADLVLCQPNFTSNTANNGGLSASSLNNPRRVMISGGKLYVSDSILAKGNVKIDNNLNVGKVTSLNDSLYVKGQARFDSLLTINDSLRVKGNVLIDTNLTVGKDLEIKGNLILNSGLQFNDSLIVSKGARIEQSILAKSKLYVSDSLLAKGNVKIDNNLIHI
jgi:UDP-3-O-[3-hydroxymyristoyl] glucosamine N-acyltransferase